MAMHASVSATFPSLSAAEAAIASLLRTGLRGPDVVLTRDRDGRSYVVTVAANERVNAVEDVLRRHVPVHRRTSIYDAQQPSKAGLASGLDFVPEADRLEQDYPWLPDLPRGMAQRSLDASSEADWLEQHEAVYASEVPDNLSLKTVVPEADYAEQMASAYPEPPEREDG